MSDTQKTNEENPTEVLSPEPVAVAVPENTSSDSQSWASDLVASDERLNETSLDQAAGIRKELKKQHAHEPVVKPASGIFEDFDDDAASKRIVRDVNMVLDIPVDLSVEIGRTKLPIKQILQLSQGSVVELNSIAGEPMTVLVNDRPIARGEIVVVNDKFAIRLTDVTDPKEREKAFGG